MRAYVRTGLVLAVAVALVALFLQNVDLSRVAAEMSLARPGWLAVSLAASFINLAIRSRRWQLLLRPLGRTSFGAAFRATAVGFAASSVLPARAGEVIRPYFLARQARRDQATPMNATGAFATIVLERLLDLVTVLILLAFYVFVFGRDRVSATPRFVPVLTLAGVTAGAGACVGFLVLFVLAANPERLRRAMTGIERFVPAAFAGLLVRLPERFAEGLGAMRRPGSIVAALAWSFPLWLSIAAGIWAVTTAFHLAVPFTGSFLLLAMLVLGVAVPTPGAVGGFHEAFRLGTTVFFQAPDAAAVGAAILLHAFSIGPSLLLGAWFVAQEGLNLSNVRRLAVQAEPAHRA